MRVVPLAELGQALNPGPGQRIIAVLKASLDASLDQPKEGVTAVAGYVAPLDEWTAVEQAWITAVDEWGIGCFHLSELPREIGNERARLCALHFAQIIKHSKLCAVGAAMLDMDWNEPDWLHMTTKKLASRYKQCLDMSLDVLGDYTRKFFPSEPVTIIFCADEKEKYIEEAFELKQDKYEHFYTFAIVSGKRTRPVPLQCADLGVGMLRRSWKAIVQNPEINDRPWGDMPKGKGTRSRISFWSLRQGAVLTRAMKLYMKRLSD